MKDKILENIVEAIQKCNFVVPKEFGLDRPAKSELGDLSSNVAMIISSRDKKNPTEVAKLIVEKIDLDIIEKIDIAGPGFINIFIKNKAYFSLLEKIVAEKENFGRVSKKKTKVQVEYVSANPTGPLHIGNARGGPIGEALANLFDFLGYEVEREFYINDIGGQITKFAKTLYYWYAVKIDERFEFPEGGYPGAYMKEISEKIQKEHAEKLKAFKDQEEFLPFFQKEGLYHTVKSIREDCELLGIKFDHWTNQSDFENNGKTERIIESLKENDFTENKEGALWFKNSADPDFQDQESVLVKSGGNDLTYFADDITYHIDKFDRGFDRVIDVWGSNHHGHIQRLKSAIKSLNYNDEKLDIILYQYVRLKNAGEAVKMGKRLGNFVTLRQVIESGVAPDAFKYFILAQNPNTPFDFDLALAKDTSDKNPIYYVEYAHARICSILAKAGESKLDEKADLTLLDDPKELALIKELIVFPELLSEVCKNFQLQALPSYAYKIAQLFHDFYGSCKVISDDKKLTSARLSLILATKYVLYNALKICGIEAPDKM